jgi:putative transposase
MITMLPVTLRLNLAPPLPRAAYRVVAIRWLPRTKAEWATFTASRMEVARLRNAMVRIHARIRRLNWKWPSRALWERWARGKFPALSAQSVQQAVSDFCDTIAATTASRKEQRTADREATTRYPWRTHRYRDVVYTNQDATVRSGVLRLSHGRGNKPLTVTLPRALPGRLMEVSIAFGVVRLVCEVPAAPAVSDAPVIGVDLGVNTLLAATDGQKAIVVSGREAKSIVRYRNKATASLRSRMDHAKRGSKRHKHLARALYKMLDKSARRLGDVLHKATRKVADAFPGHHAVVGKPFNDAARRTGRKQAQQVSSASNARLIVMLGYKLAGASEISEAYSSQTCPGCGCRQTCRRVYQCRVCGLTLPRDVVGAVNIRSLGIHGEMVTRQPIPRDVRFVRPLYKYPGPAWAGPARSGGTPARRAA